MNTDTPQNAWPPDGWRRIYAHTVDRNGTQVHAGTRVRVVALALDSFQDFALWERRNFLSMVDEVFEVEEIDQLTAGARVRKEWVDDDGSHELALDLEPHEMEVVEACSALDD